MAYQAVPQNEPTIAPVVCHDIDLLDQTLLPGRSVVLHLTAIVEVAVAIRTMGVCSARRLLRGFWLACVLSPDILRPQ